MENDYLNDSPNIYLEFSDLNSSEYNEEQAKYFLSQQKRVDKTKRAMFKNKNPSCFHKFKKSFIIKKTNKTDLSNCLKEIKSFAYNDEIEIPKKIQSVKKKTIEVNSLLNYNIRFYYCN